MIEYYHVKRRSGGTLLDVATYVQISMAGAAISQTMNEPGITVESESNSPSGSPCGCSSGDWSVIRFTTLMTRILSCGTCVRSRSTAASVSRVGTSPQQTITTSGSEPLSLEAHSQMPMPAVQCRMA